MTTHKKLIATAIGLCLVCTLQAQDLTNISTKEGFKISGSINLDLGFYEAFGIDPRRDRFAYLLSGNLNPRIAGIDMPLSATYSQQETSFRQPVLQPFNQIGLSPTYKNVTAHLGFRNLNYSSLTLGGHTFLGAGTDVQLPVKKGPFDYKVSAMYGRFRRAVDPFDAQEAGFAPVYRRMGYAVSLGLIAKKNQKNNLDLILFKGWDDTESIEAPLLDQNVKPEENLVLGFKGQLEPVKNFVLTADVARSALSRDRRLEKGDGARGMFRAFEGIFNANASTQYNTGMKLGARYGIGNFSLGLNYNRIDPDYRSLGTFFFQNDLEDITVSGAASFFKNKANFSASVGRQRNNLGNQQNASQSRNIGSLNWTHAPTDKFNYFLSFSNYSSSLIVVQDILTDSLNLYQINTNYNAGAGYTFGSDKLVSRINLQGGYQVGNARDEYFIQETITRFYNAAAAYQLVLTPQNLSFQLALNYTRNIMPELVIDNLGPTLAIGKKFPKQGIDLRYAFSYITVGENANVLNNRFNLSYRIAKKHRFRFGFALLNRTDSVDADRAFSELRGTTGYTYTF